MFLGKKGTLLIREIVTIISIIHAVSISSTSKLELLMTPVAAVA